MAVLTLNVVIQCSVCTEHKGRFRVPFTGESEVAEEPRACSSTFRGPLGSLVLCSPMSAVTEVFLALASLGCTPVTPTATLVFDTHCAGCSPVDTRRPAQWWACGVWSGWDGTLASLAGSPAGGRLWAPALVVRQEDTDLMGLQQQLLPIRLLSRPALEPCPLGLSRQAPPITGPGRPSLWRNSWPMHLLSLSP